MSAARQTRGRLNMQPPGLNIYAEQPCTENARFWRMWTVVMDVRGGCGRVQWAVQPPSTGRMTPVR